MLNDHFMSRASHVLCVGKILGLRFDRFCRLGTFARGLAMNEITSNITIAVIIVYFACYGMEYLSEKYQKGERLYVARWAHNPCAINRQQRGKLRIFN